MNKKSRLFKRPAFLILNEGTISNQEMLTYSKGTYSPFITGNLYQIELLS